MKKQVFLILANLLFYVSLCIGQTIVLEGYVFEGNNRGFLNEVEIAIHDASTKALITNASTDDSGLFTAELPANKDYILKISKDLFFPKEENLSTKGKSAGEKVYSKVKLERKPGYIFDVTLAESGSPTATVDAITGAKIEVFNNTKMKETLVVDSLAGINFDVTFERGNHYTVLIRKEGYFNKRLEAYVDVEGCILCFEGVGTVTPGVSDVMSEGFQIGSVLANIELEPAKLNSTIEVENIYYDLNKHEIRRDAAVELDKVVKLLNDNPAIILELGSHTDSRGGTRHNMQLSTRRAEAAVNYIIEKGGVSSNRISSKGYGESNLVNNCKDGVKCSEEAHQKNRRTELKVVGFEAVDPLSDRSLADMLIEEKLLREIENSEQIQVKEGEVPDFLNKSKPTSTSSKSNTYSTTNSNSLPKGNTPTTNTNVVPSVKIEEVAKETKVISQGNDKISTASSNKANSVKQTANTGIITSAQKAMDTNNNGETLVSGSEVMAPNKTKSTSISGNTNPGILNFDESKIMLVRNGQVEMVTKMIELQLNQRITDMLLAKNVYLNNGGELKTYKFDTIDKMPIELLNVFLKKLAIIEKPDGWKIFQLEKGAMMPKEILDAIK